MFRRFLAIPMAALVAGASFAQTQSTDQDWCRDTGRNYGRDLESVCEVRELKGSGASQLDISTANGSINVTGSSRRDIVVHARVVAMAETESDARALAREVSVTLENGRVKATGPDGTRRRSWWISYRAEVPSSLDLSLDSSNGSVGITGVRGRIDAESTNGSLRLADLGGHVNARTTNGAVHVTLSGTKWDGEGLTVVTSNGSARVEMPESYNARLIAGTNNGSLNIDVPVTVQGRISKKLDTTLGSGGAPIEVRTSNGSVRIGRR